MILNEPPEVWLSPPPVALTVVPSPPRGSGPTFSFARVAAFTAFDSGCRISAWWIFLLAVLPRLHVGAEPLGQLGHRFVHALRDERVARRRSGWRRSGRRARAASRSASSSSRGCRRRLARAPPARPPRACWRAGGAATSRRCRPRPSPCRARSPTCVSRSRARALAGFGERHVAQQRRQRAGRRSTGRRSAAASSRRR